MEVKLKEVNTESAKPKVNVRDLESRSHWDNIRIFGFPGKVEGPFAYHLCSQLLYKHFGDGELNSVPELERAQQQPNLVPVRGQVWLSFASIHIKTCELVSYVSEAWMHRVKLKYKVKFGFNNYFSVRLILQFQLS